MIRTGLLTAAVLLVPAFASAADRTMPSKTQDEKFLMGATSGGNFEVKSSQLAVSKVSNPQIKEFAQQMIDAHTKANNELLAILQKKGKTVVQGLDPVHTAIYTKLSGESGKDFEECYLGDQILAHEAAVMCFDKESKFGTDPEIKAFATKMLPDIKHHLMMARKICKDCEEKMMMEHGK